MPMQKYKIVWGRTANREYEHAIRWYAERSEKATIGFDEMIMRTERLILLQPQMYPQTKWGLRKAVLKDYPYALYYFLETEDRIRITALLHTSMDADSRMQNRIAE